MKRYLSLILCIMFLLCSTPSFALGQRIKGDVVLRSYINYGMTKEEVIEAETKNGIAKDAWTINDTEIQLSNALLAGYENSDLIYYFSSDNHLTAMEYNLSGIYDPSSKFHTSDDGASEKNNKRYNDLKLALTEKYGKPNWDTYWGIGSFHEVFSSKSLNGVSWILEYDDCYLNIQLWNRKLMSSYYCDIVYATIPKEALSWQVKKEDSRHNDL